MSPLELRAWKDAQSLGTTELAKVLGVDRATAKRWLAGTSPISRTAELLTRALDAYHAARSELAKRPLAEYPQ